MIRKQKTELIKDTTFDTSDDDSDCAGGLTDIAAYDSLSEPEDMSADAYDPFDKLSRGLDELKGLALDINHTLQGQGETIDNATKSLDATSDALKLATKLERSKNAYIGGAVLSGVIIGSAVILPLVGPIMVSVPVAAYCLYKIGKINKHQT